MNAPSRDLKYLFDKNVLPSNNKPYQPMYLMCLQGVVHFSDKLFSSTSGKIMIFSIQRTKVTLKVIDLCEPIEVNEMHNFTQVRKYFSLIFYRLEAVGNPQYAE